MTRIRITYNGQLALTTAQAAARWGVRPATMRKEIERLRIVALPNPLDARTPLYSAKALDAAMRARPQASRYVDAQGASA